MATGLFGTRMSFVPLEGASPSGDGLRVPFSKDKVKDAPHAEADGHLSPEEEAALYRHTAWRTPVTRRTPATTPAARTRTTP